MVTHRYTCTRTDTYLCAQIHMDTLRLHRCALIHTDTHRYTQMHTDTHRHTHIHTYIYVQYLSLYNYFFFVAHRAHTAASICGYAHAGRIAAVPQSLMPRGRFDFESLEFNAQMFLNQSSLEANEQWLEVEINLFLCASLRGGAEKRTASFPLDGRVLLFRGTCSWKARHILPASPPFLGAIRQPRVNVPLDGLKNVAIITPFCRGNAGSVAGTCPADGLCNFASITFFCRGNAGNFAGTSQATDIEC